MIPFTVAATLDERKITFVLRSFVEAADEDYLLARWAFHNGLFTKFFWCCAQALEKYLKALILFKGGSTKRHGHDLSELLSTLLQSQVPVPNIDGRIDYPQGVVGEDCSKRVASVEEYVAVVNSIGNPDNRYNLTAIDLRGPCLLFAFDFLCFHLRRGIRLSIRPGQDYYLTKPIFEFSSRERPIVEMGWLIDRDLPLETLYSGYKIVGQTLDLETSFRLNNPYFWGEQFQKGKLFSGLVVRGGAYWVMTEWQGKIDPSEENLAIISEFVDWAEENVRLPKSRQRKRGKR